ncbi:MAG: hypothetical protein Q8K68_03335 [Nitrospirota bacterium]|nr:hypothetical protein [Nitrospirota bacterium]
MAIPGNVKSMAINNEPDHALCRIKRPVMALDPEIVLEDFTLFGKFSAACGINMAVTAYFACLACITQQCRNRCRAKKL